MLGNYYGYGRISNDKFREYRHDAGRLQHHNNRWTNSNVLGGKTMNENLLDFIEDNITEINLDFTDSVSEGVDYE
tara:strand:+ start:724 stop:948 length:225 start_codon:yes stop_codon:yes gene_type:complete